jgi:hypothetical protein
MADTTSNIPGVFRGNSRMASQQDLAILRQEIRQLIAGPINEVSENGYIPWKYNNDGSLDIDYLFPELVTQFKENTGLAINRNGISFTKDVKTINFTGNYVYLDLDENGNLVCDIREPQEEVSRFNGRDGVTDALVKIENEIIEDMIIPDTSKLTENSVYGDWVPGTKHPGLNWNRNDVYDALKLYTNERCYASSLSSYFEVLVYDSYNTLYASFVSKSITGSTRVGEKLEPASSGYSFHIGIAITEFKEENNGYSFIPKFDLNLIGILGTAGGRFRVKIVHHDAMFHNQYVSQDLLYNVGKVPIISSPYFQIITDTSVKQENAVTYQWCSGLKYVTNGSILLSLDSIRNLNNMAAIDDKISYSFDIANQKLMDAEFTNYSLDLDHVAKWQTYLYLNKETFNNTQTSGYVIAKNAFGESDQYVVNISLLLNSVSTNRISDNLNEYFTDESYRNLHNFKTNGSYLSLVSWDSKENLKTYDEGLGLMVTPGKGLTYPSGDWTTFIPTGAPNYNDLSFLSNEKYFARTFIGNTKLKFGGIFEFEGLSKKDFLDSRISMIISCDNGTTWYSLKDVRGVETTIIRDDYSAVNVTGILTNIAEKDGKLQVSWMYPGTVSSSNKVYFKLGMKQTSPFCIKAISLLNSDGTKDW